MESIMDLGIHNPDKLPGQEQVRNLTHNDAWAAYARFATLS
jgi:hypothetical protein